MKVLIVRLSALGDLVMATPLLAALKTRFPNAEIHWAVQPEFADVIRNHPLIDQLILIPKGRWKEAFKAGKWLGVWREIRALKQQLRAQEFDLALDLQGLIKSALWVKWSSAKRKVGLNAKEGTARWMDEVVSGDAVDGALISSEYEALAAYLGCDTRQFWMQLPTQLDTPKSESLFAQVGNNYLVFCPFTTRPQKHWFAENWQSLACLFPSWQPIVILGGPADVAAAQALMQAMPQQVVNLVGQTQIQEAIALIRRAQGVIGVDTGLTHIGIAEKRPTLALFGSTLPYQNPRTQQAQVLYHKMPCSPCRRHPTCDGRFDCMRALTPDRVFQAWQHLLEQK
ncbi:MAG: lipopolysaccharide heptosyltransferase I [Thiotrichales bacterium]|nr:lipopolysaccharide heptosyltransferase I [Thiotrichales bacterium]